MISMPLPAINIVLIGAYHVNSTSVNSMLMAAEIIALIPILYSFTMIDFNKGRKETTLRCLIYSAFVFAILVTNIFITFDCVQTPSCVRMAVVDRVITLLESLLGGVMVASLTLFELKTDERGYAHPPPPSPLVCLPILMLFKLDEEY